MFLAGAAALVTFTDAASIVTDKYNIRFGDGEKNLIVSKVRLVPYMNPERIIGTKGFDDFFIYVMLRNFSDRQLMITSAKVEFDSDIQPVKLGDAGGYGTCVFGTDLNKNVPLSVGAGETKWIKIERSIKLSGFYAELERIVTSGVKIHTEDFPETIINISFVESVNESLAVAYGSSASINITVYTGVESILKKHSVLLADGKDIFANDGSIQHDYLLARWAADDSTRTSLFDDCSTMGRFELEDSA